MSKKIISLKTLTGATIFIIFLFIVFASSTNAITYTPSVNIAGEGEITFTGKDTTQISNLIIRVYKYATGVVGLLAAVMLMVGGLIWLTSGGSADKISKAKDIISGSIFGMILVLTTVTILGTINEDLISFKPIIIPDMQGLSGCCEVKQTNTTEKLCDSTGWDSSKTWNSTSNSCNEKQLGCCKYSVAGGDDPNVCNLTYPEFCNTEEADYTFSPNQTAFECENGCDY